MKAKAGLCSAVLGISSLVWEASCLVVCACPHACLDLLIPKLIVGNCWISLILAALIFHDINSFFLVSFFFLS